MSTVDKVTADKVVAGEFAIDGWVRIIKYTNAWGAEAYGLEKANTIGRYQASDYVINPEVYWQKE